jgi:hypothetical protein
VKRRELLVGLAAAAIAEGCTSQRPGSVRQSQTQESQARYTRQIALPRPSVAGTVSLEEAIERRRSLRTFGPGPLSVGTIGQLLWAGQGVTSPDGKRAAPSAGALYPLELYAVTAAEVPIRSRITAPETVASRGSPRLPAARWPSLRCQRMRRAPEVSSFPCGPKPWAGAV